jgi:hypothetical protein
MYRYIIGVFFFTVWLAELNSRYQIFYCTGGAESGHCGQRARGEQHRCWGHSGKACLIVLPVLRIRIGPGFSWITYYIKLCWKKKGRTKKENEEIFMI